MHLAEPDCADPNLSEECHDSTVSYLIRYLENAEAEHKSLHARLLDAECGWAKAREDAELAEQSTRDAMERADGAETVMKSVQEESEFLLKKVEEELQAEIDVSK